MTAQASKSKNFIPISTKRPKQVKITKSLIIAGDFNATTGVAKYKSNFDEKKIVTDIDFNDGMRLKQFCRTHALNISSISSNTDYYIETPGIATIKRLEKL